VKSAKRNSNDFKLDDIFESFYSKDTGKYPTTVPIAKSTTRNGGMLNDLFDGDSKHFSASVALQRRRQPSQQVFVSNNK
jgi:hypothetical protein